MQRQTWSASYRRMIRHGQARGRGCKFARPIRASSDRRRHRSRDRNAHGACRRRWRDYRPAVSAEWVGRLRACDGDDAARSGDLPVPRRAIGVAYVPVDMAGRTLTVEAGEGLQNVRPRTRIEVPVRVSGGGGERVRVAIAMVDEGILNITKYESPNRSNTSSAAVPRRRNPRRLWAVA